MPIALTLAMAALAGCGGGAGAAGHAVRPDEGTAASALGEPGGAACGAVGDRDQPLIVDWKAHERTNLEEAMEDGVAVVHYECGSLRLLRGCRLDGSYEFLATSRKEQVVQLADSDEVKANLPMLGQALAKDLSASLSRGSTLDLAMVLVGKKRTTVTEAKRERLVGGAACEGATHFVRGAFVGAFAMGTGVRGEVRSVAYVVDASSKSSKLTQYRDGDAGKCAEASRESKEAPEGCEAILRLELAALSTPAPEEALRATGATCPEGLVLSGGKCTKPSKAASFQCRGGDPLECQTQCDLGHAGSCRSLGAIHALGKGVPKDDARAASLFKKACDAGDEAGCSGLGVLYDRGHGVPKDEARAAALHKKACDAGEVLGCVNLGVSYGFGRGVAKDYARAVAHFKRACDGGHAGGCYNLGVMYASGRGVEQDYLRAASLFKRACDGGHASGCGNLGVMYENGEGVTRDFARAAALHEKACEDGAAAGCLHLGVSHLHGAGVAKDVARAASLFKKACYDGEAEGCERLGTLVESGEDAGPGTPSAVELYRRACEGGEHRGCEALDRLGGAP